MCIKTTWLTLKSIQNKVTLAILVAAGVLSAAQVSAQMAVGKQKFVGNIVAGSVPSSFSTYWNQITPENSGKWGALESTQGTMNWSQLDTAYNFARANGYKFKQHTFVWGSQEPSWIGSLSAANQKAAVVNLMTKVCARYPNMDFIDVVNEPLHAPSSIRAALGGDGSTGWDWIIWSFQQARTICPNAKLLINEYGIISDTNATSNYKKIITLLKDRGLVDGIGIQCHQFNMDTVSTATMKTNLDSLAATGLPIYVSELDMTGDDATQLARYKEKFPVLWNHSGVAGITLWGYIQGQTWKDNTHLLNTNGTERPALTWLKSFVSGTTNTSVAASSRSSTAVASSKSASSTPATPASSKAASSVASGAGGVKCTYVVSNSWNTGFTGLIRVTNSGTTTKSGWNASWQYTGANRITGSWNATVTGSNPYSASNLSWNGTIGAGQSVEFGFQGLSNGGAVETPAVTCK